MNVVDIVLKQLCVVLQLCIVSALGFVLYFITYLPDERTYTQFIIKVRGKKRKRQKEKDGEKIYNYEHLSYSIYTLAMDCIIGLRLLKCVQG